MPVLACAAWLGALGGLAVGWWAATVAAGLAAAWLLVHRRRRTLAAALLLAAAGATATTIRTESLATGPVAALAADRAAVEAVGTVTTDPHVVTGKYGDIVVLHVRIHQVHGRGTTWAVAAPVVVLAPDHWRSVQLGSTVRLSGRLDRADGDAAALLSVRGPPEVVTGPDLWWRGAASVRGAIRVAVAGRPTDQRALVPALVDGDDAAVPQQLTDDFRTTGLTHLLAVSGTNLTLVVGFLVAVARWCRVRGRALLVVGAFGIAGFVLLARTEPSVVRAAVMGTVALVALGTDGRQRGSRALGVAVLVLVLLQPQLAVSAGFALSVLATAGILLLAPGWRDALGRWCPRWAAEAIAVPMAAQLACTPLVAAISGRVSLVAVLANLLVGPVVGPATVLGLAGGLAELVAPPLGRLLGTAAGWCVGWVVVVATHCAAVPTAVIGWGTGVLALGVLTAVSLAVAVWGPLLVRRRWAGLAMAVVMVGTVLVRLPTPGWPPAGWVLVACDVGQGDALVLNAAPGAAVVVDAGPDPVPVDRCLDRLGVRSIPLLVLSHFHADHVDGLAGVLDGRKVGAIETTRLLDPPGGVEEVDRLAGRLGLTPTPAPYGKVLTVGAVTLEALWPPPDSPVVGPGDGSTANEASVVLLVQVSGIRLLLTGDVEPVGQEALAAAYPGLRVDVLKVPHHGSRYQDEGWLLSLHPHVAVVSVGADNDYGHPAASTLTPLEAAGIQVLRTDEDGSIAVAVHDGRVTTRTG
jgi:competence protein ComEC